MEQGEIRGWLVTEKIFYIVYRTHAQRFNSAKGNEDMIRTVLPLPKTLPCVYHKKGVCIQKQTHDTKGEMYWTNMYVPHVGQKKAKHMHIHKLNDEKVQKMNSCSDMALVSSDGHKVSTFINSGYSGYEEMPLQILVVVFHLV